MGHTVLLLFLVAAFGSGVPVQAPAQARTPDHRPFTGVVNADRLRIRDTPTLSARVAGHLNTGDEVVIVSRGPERVPIGEMNDYWLAILDDGGHIVWTYGAFIDTPESLDGQLIRAFIDHAPGPYDLTFMLEQVGVDPDAPIVQPDGAVTYPLCLAAETADTEAAGMLLDAGADPNVECEESGADGRYRFAPIHPAVEQVAYDLVTMLTEHGADLDAVRTRTPADGSAPFRDTPLIIATRTDWNMASSVIAAGATIDLAVETNDGTGAVRTLDADTVAREEENYYVQSLLDDARSQ